MKTKPPMEGHVGNGGPMYPIVTVDADLTTHVSTSATMMDFFAAHAPGQVPEWFTVDSEPKPQQLTIPDAVAALPAFAELSPEGQGNVLSWLRDGCWDLEGKEAEVANEAAAAIDASVDKVAEWESRANLRAAERFFAWRWFYAHQMLLTREMIG